MTIIGFISILIGIYYLPAWETKYNEERRPIPKWYYIALSFSAFVTLIYVPAVISILLGKLKIENAWILLLGSILCYIALYKVYKYRLYSQKSIQSLEDNNKRTS